MHMNLAEIGHAVREARRAAKRTQAELAKALGMSRASISGVENGTVREIGVRKLMALCASLGLALEVVTPGRRPTLFELRQERRGLAPRT
jgi:HTH-type transcriptional regulator / antitoxin HipB